MTAMQVVFLAVVLGGVAGLFVALNMRAWKGTRKSIKTLARAKQQTAKTRKAIKSLTEDRIALTIGEPSIDFDIDKYK